MKYPTDVDLKTLDELEQFFEKYNIPQETVRFFVKQNRTDAKCFGIYKNASGEFVVYKNKRDGTQAVRYQGTDEAEAVQIFFDKFKEELHLRDVNKQLNSSMNRDEYYAEQRKKAKRKMLAQIGIAGGIVALVLGASIWVRKAFNIPRSGYYMIDDEPYYYRGNHWWYYDDSDDDWLIYYGMDYTSEEYYDDYLGSSYDSDYDFSSITTADDYYEYYSDEDSDSDDYYDSYDYDSWDSSDTDWDSDW